jgi:hypothetical protein
MKKKTKFTDNELNTFAVLIRKNERLDCVHKLEQLVSEIELMRFIEKWNNDKDEYILLGVKFAINRLKGRKIGDSDE